MDITHFKVRCFICFKRFEVPRLPNSAYGEQLFSNDKNEFRYFNWLDNEDIKNSVDYILSQDADLQIENDRTKGNTVFEIVAQLADGNFKAEFGYSKCTRCKNRLHSQPNTKVAKIAVKLLTFNEISQLDLDEQLRRIKKR